MIDQYSRTITGVAFAGGWRYAATDGSFQCALPAKDDAAALAIANANPPHHLQQPEKTPEELARVDEILDAMDKMTARQSEKLKQILSKAN